MVAATPSRTSKATVRSGMSGEAANGLGRTPRDLGSTRRPRYLLPVADSVENG